MLAFAAVVGFAGAANAAADSVTAKSYVDSLYVANKGAISLETTRATGVEGDRSKLNAFTTGFFYSSTANAPLDLANAIVKENERATTVEGDINSATTGLKHFKVKGDLEGQDLATAINSTYDKAISAASDAETAAKSYADQVAAAAKTTAESTAATKADAALATAKSYTDTAVSNAKSYADDEIDKLDADVNSQTNKDKNDNLIITNVDATVTEVDGVITKVESELNVDGCTEGQVVVYKKGKLVCQSVVAYDANNKKYYAEDAASTTYDDYKMGGNY